MIKVIDKNSIDKNDRLNYLRNPLINQYTDIILRVSETDTSLLVKVTFVSKNETYSLEEEFSKEEFKNCVTEITLLKSTVLSKYSKLLLLRKYYKLPTAITSPDNNRCFWCASVFISDDVTYIVPRVRLNANSNHFDNCEYTEVPFDIKNSQQILFDFCPEAKAIADNWYTKKIYLGDIDVNSSISYLENQVDILYKIIEKLVEKTGIDVSEYKEVLDAVENNSSLKVNTIDKVTSKINKDKALVRTCQERYYSKLNKSE